MILQNLILRKHMMRMTRQLKVLFAAFVVIITSCTSTTAEQHEDDKLPVNVIAIPLTKGWGYEIYVDNKLFIKQDHVPALSGNYAFADKTAALKTANMVIAKMKQGKKPFLTPDELTDAGIQTTKQATTN